MPLRRSENKNIVLKKPTRIIIIGAGLGGLYVAKTLGNAGFDITVYEKRKRDDLGYPWHDAISRNTFKKTDIDVPDDFILNKQILNFYSPMGEGFIRQAEKQRKNFDVDRTKLIYLLVELAESCCDVQFESDVEGLIIDGEKVVGVRVNGKEESCDLVIDSSGLFSPYREQVPSLFMTDDKLQSGDYLAAFRGVFKKSDSAISPSNVYLMPENYSVLWCKDMPDPAYADVLITNFGSLDKEQITCALDYLKQRNPLLTDEFVTYRADAIPVRYPLATIVADGYAVIGNAAFMTKPTSGSGIENTLKAAVILSDVIKKAADFSAKSLWKYAVRVNVAFGSNCYMAYVARAKFQNLDKEKLAWLFNSGILNESLLALARFDFKYLSNFKLNSVISSLHLAKTQRDFLREIEGIISLAVRAKILALRMPLAYDIDNVAKWKTAYDALCDRTR